MFMANNLQMYRVEFGQNIGGINDSTQITSVKQNEALDIHNVRLIPTGGIQKRKGYYVVNTASLVGSGTITGIFNYLRFTGNSDLIVCVNSGTSASKIYKKDAGTNTFTSITPSGTFAGGDVTFAVSNDILMIASDGGSNILKWDGSATACTDLNTATAPLGQVVTDWNRHAVALKIPARGSNFEISHQGDSTQWRNSDRFPTDRQTVGATSLLGKLYVFTTDRMYAVSGNDRDNISMLPVRRSVGGTNQRSIVNVANRNLIVWPWRGNFYEFDGTTTNIISNRLERPLENTSDFFNVNQSLFDNIQGVNIASESRVSFLIAARNKTQNSFVLNYHYDLRTPDPKTGKSIGAWTVDKYDRNFAYLAVSVEDEKEILYAGDYDGHVCRLDVGDADGDSSEDANDGNAIPSRYQTGPFHNNMPDMTKRWREIIPVVGQTSSGTVTISTAENWAGSFITADTVALTTGGFASYWGVSKWGEDLWGAAISVIKRLSLSNRSEALSIKFSDSSKDPAWRIDTWVLRFQVLPGLRRFP
jgi:hypothetical protein